MTIDEMIEVLEAHTRGEKIEWYDNTYKTWRPNGASDRFDFGTLDYRIAKPEPKKIKLQAWMNTFHGAIEYRKLPHGFHDNAEWIRIPEEDKEITLP